MLTIRLPIDLEKRLTDLSARIGKTKTAIIVLKTKGFDTRKNAPILGCFFRFYSVKTVL